MRRRILIWSAAGLVLLAVASQLILPRLAEDRVADRLTQQGGTADVSVSAFPAARLLFGDGDSLTVNASGIDLPGTTETHVFDRLDGFDRVSVRIERSRVGPFDLRSFALTRQGSAPYHLVTSSQTSGKELAGYAAGQVGGIGGALLRFGAGQVPDAGERIPVRLDMQLESDDGVVRVVSGGGAIAGLPTGPLAELITSLVAVQL